MGRYFGEGGCLSSDIYNMAVLKGLQWLPVRWNKFVMMSENGWMSTQMPIMMLFDMFFCVRRFLRAHYQLICCLATFAACSVTALWSRRILTLEGWVINLALRGGGGIVKETMHKRTTRDKQENSYTRKSQLDDNVLLCQNVWTESGRAQPVNHNLPFLSF